MELGIYPLCDTNTWSGTDLILNADIPEIKEFKARLYWYHTFLNWFCVSYIHLHNNSLTCEHRFAEEQLDDVNPTQHSSQFSQGSQITQQTDIMSKVNFLTLSAVNHVQHVRSFLCHLEFNSNTLKAII